MKTMLRVAAAIFAATGVARAAHVNFWTLGSASDFSSGTVTGVSVFPDGSVKLSQTADRIAGLEGHNLICAAEGARGELYFGAAEGGAIFEAGASGPARRIAGLPEPAVTALLALPDGTLLAAGAPGGKIYRIARGRAAIFSETGSLYVWALARGASGEVLAGTGLPARILRLEDGHAPATVANVPDEHVRSLAVGRDGVIWAGTSGKGLVMAVADGKLRTVFDSQKPEISAIAPAEDGSVYAAAVAGHAASAPAPAGAPAPPTSPRPEKQKPEGPSPDEEDHPSVTVTVSTAEPVAAPRAAASAGGPESAEIVRAGLDGVVSTVWSSREESVFALRWDAARGGLLAATGPKGRVYLVGPHQASLVASFDERRVVAWLPDGAVLSAAGAALRLAPAREGEYVSSSRDTGRTSRFGAFRIEAAEPAGTSLTVSFRSGNSSAPDPTWSPWSAPVPAARAGRIDAPPGRYLQWKAVFRGNGAGQSPAISRVECAFENLDTPPRVESLQVAVSGPFEGLGAASSDAGALRSAGAGFFPPVPGAPGSALSRGRDHGIVTLQWKGVDPDGDALVYDVAVKPERAQRWVTIRRNVSETSLAFDSDLLPDGRYLFRVTASDRESSQEAPQEDARVSEPVVVDNTPPEIQVEESGPSGVRVRVRDALSPIAQFAWSVDAGPWHPVPAQDGMSDSPQEEFVVRVPPAERGGYLLLRAVDAAGNVASRSVPSP